MDQIHFSLIAVEDNMAQAEVIVATRGMEEEKDFFMELSPYVKLEISRRRVI